MSTAPNPCRTAIWTDAERAQTTALILQKMGPMIQPSVLGAPKAASLAQLASEYDCPTTDDARRLVVDHPADFLLIHCTQRIDSADVQQAVRAGATVLAIEPIVSEFDGVTSKSFADFDRASARRRADTTLETPASEHDVRAAEPQPTFGRVCWATAFEFAQGWKLAADMHESIGPTDAIVFQSQGRRSQCSLFARLFDGWREIVRLGARPDSIEASICGGTGRPTDRVCDLTGTLTAHARLPNGSSALLAVSDSCGDWSRSVQIIGRRGRLHVTDGGYRLSGDDAPPHGDTRAAHQAISLADVVAERWRQAIDNRELPSRPVPQSDVLACCLASALSARTGQPESPAKLMRIAAT